MASRLFLVLTAWMPQMVCVGLVGISLFLTHVAPAQVNNDGAKPPRSYELGKKWLALQPELGKARMAQSDMRRALERLEEDRSEAAADIASLKFTIALGVLKNLGKVACDFDPFKSCKLAMSAAESLNEAWHCGERGSDQWKACIRGPVAYGSAWAGRGGEAAERIAGRVAASTEGAIALKDPSETLQAAQAGVEATGLKYSGAASGVIGGVKNYQDYTETKDLEGHVNNQFERSLRTASASMDKVESKIRELEQTAESTYTAYLSERKKERAQQEKELSESDKKEASGDQKKDSASQAKDKGAKTKKGQLVELDDPDFPSSGAASQRAQSNNGGGSQSASQGQSGKTIYYDPEVWRLGEEVPGVERPADWDKPKAKPCEDLRGNRIPCKKEQPEESQTDVEDRKTTEQLMADLDQMANQPEEPADLGASGTGPSSKGDMLAMLKGARSAMGTYRQGRDLTDSLKSSGGGSCPNVVPFPPEAVAIIQRKGQSLPPMPSIDAMIAQGGSPQAVASLTRQQIQSNQQALAQWPPGREPDTRRLLELTTQHNQAILSAVECRAGNRAGADPAASPPSRPSSRPQASHPSSDSRPPSRGGQGYNDAR